MTSLQALEHSSGVPDQSDAKEQDRTPWNPWSLVGFRLASSYLLISWLTVYGVLQVIPWIGSSLERGIERLWGIPVHWVGIHFLHLVGIASTFHASDSRDTALDWITAGLVIPAAGLVTVLWSMLDRKRTNYTRAGDWLRYILRLGVIFLMLRYALMKIFPVQMAPPSLAVLNEPLGNTSPMTLLWTTLGLHPAYEMLAGWIEAAAALLLVFRRTALLGASLVIVVMSNVLLYNIFFDVPVKLGAANILLLAVALTFPDLRVLWRLIILRQKVGLTSRWAPASEQAGWRWAFSAGEICFVVFALLQFVPPYAAAYSALGASLKSPSPLSGIWHVDSVIRDDNGLEVATPVLTGLGQPMTEISFEPDGMVMVRAADGMLWRAYVQINAAKHTLTLGSGYFDGDRFAATYTMIQPDADDLILKPIGKAATTNGVVKLSRVPLPNRYPLLEERSHWVNEWALER